MSKRKIIAEIQCRGCQEKNHVTCDVPKFFEPKFTEFECGGCGSISRVKLSADHKKGGLKSGQVLVRNIHFKPSPLFLKMMEEEREHMEKPLEIEVVDGSGAKIGEVRTNPTSEEVANERTN